MNWYLAKLVFQITCGEGTHTPQFDEQLRLVEAGSREEALGKACLLGTREEEEFFNAKDQLVSWRFINVSELNAINRLYDGMELYSRIEEKDNAEAYIYLVNRRAEDLFFQQPERLLNLA